ncbi:MAG: TIGR01212 family radical SAM protein [Ruminococcaceae bacterium]|nr:TIGR01212 family radical SAM protein [Oscillospiraceae bacterium]
MEDIFLKIFPYSSDNKRYHTLHYYNMQKFGERVYKAPINAGFTCPNIDGTKGFGGCIYCDGGSGYFTDSSIIPIKEQLEHQIALIHQKHPKAKINAYFQSYSNTYGNAELIKSRVEPVFDFDDVVSVSIATRADCFKKDVLDHLKELSRKTELTVELGLQTVHDHTAEIINRGHTFSEFQEGYNSLKALGIRTVVHIINGLPDENKDMMLETASVLGKMRPDGVKIHLLHVIKGTKLELMYNEGKYTPLEKEKYVDITVRQLELLPQETVIERLTGDGDKNKLIAPLWSRDKISVLGAIDKLQANLDSYQGKKLK